MENRTFWIIAGVFALIVGVIVLQPTVEEKLAPKLAEAWVAIEVEGSDLAEVGTVAIESGQRFTLRAVAGATSRDGDPVYYTEATRLRLDGREIPAEQIRRWDRSTPIKIRWYSVEGRWPYFPFDAETGIGGFQYQNFLRSDWPLAWSVPGDIDAVNDDHLEGSAAMPEQLFGTQRYQVGIELYRKAKDLVPQQVIRSWGFEQLRDQIKTFPTVIMTAPGGAGPASRVFGLTQLDPPEDSDVELLQRIEELARHGIAFSRLSLVRDLAANVGSRFAELTWRSVDLSGIVAWSDAESVARGGPQDAVAAGDLMRVGDRVVVLYKDRGELGRLDYQDLCFDFVQGAEVRALGEVFSGDGLDVETASLSAG